MPEVEQQHPDDHELPLLKKPGPGIRHFREERMPKRSRVWWKRLKVLPAFWTVACVISLVVNIILVAVLVGLARELFTIKSMVSEQLIGGLYQIRNTPLRHSG